MQGHRIINVSTLVHCRTNLAQTQEHRQAVLETLGLTDASEVAAALKDVEVAPKLAALRDLLAQCGVISMQGAEDASASGVSC